MRKSLLILTMLILSAAIGAPCARADTLYAPTFTCNPTITCTSVATAPNVSFPSPTSIVPTWDGITFPALSLIAPFSPTDAYEWDALVFTHTIGQPTPRDAIFSIVDLTQGNVVSIRVNSVPNPITGADSGPLTFAPIATPEPSAYVLMLSGIGFLFLLVRRRKGLAQGLPRAT
jgi:PEP-CTERM motif